MEDLDSGRMDSDTAARALKLSRESLYRSLKVASTSFQAINNDIVAGLSKQTLRETDSAISQIALMLGYSEHSAFVHSFSQLVGMRPCAYRAGEWGCQGSGFFGLMGGYFFRDNACFNT